MAVALGERTTETIARHARWVRISHWIVTASLLTLAFSGFVILMAHPRLYWGEVGNDLTPALSSCRSAETTSTADGTSRRPSSRRRGSGQRESDLRDLQQNGWGRSLHFLAAWCLVVPGARLSAGGHRQRPFPLALLCPRAQRARSASRVARIRRSPAPADSARDRRAAIRPAAEMRLLARWSSSLRR